MNPAASLDQCDPLRLLELVRRDDRSALDQITRCYGARLLEAGRRHCRTSTEAEDAVQDTLLLAAGGLGSFRGEGSLEHYLVRIVARACRRLSRGRKNDARIHADDATLVGTEAGPEALTARSELGSTLDQALLALAPVDRALILLAEIEEYTAAEIGRELGMSEGAVRVRLSRLRKRLRVELASWLTDDGTGTGV